MTTDISEKGLETLIMRHMTGTDGIAVSPNMVAERPPPYGGSGYTAGSPQDYDRAHALDVPQLFAFLRATQSVAFKKLALVDANDAKDIILEAIDMDSYRVEKKAAMKIALADTDAEIEPVPTDASGRKSEPELDRLSNILKTFNEQFGTLFTDTDRVAKRIREDIAPKVAADAAYQNAKENTPHTARMAHDQALAKVMQHLLTDDTQVYKQFVENESFKRFVGDMVYAITNQ